MVIRRGIILTKIFIHRSSHLLEIDCNCPFDKEKIELKASCLEQDVESNGLHFKWSSSSTAFYDTESDNIGKCSNCGCWTTDVNRDGAISDVSRGAIVADVLYCDLCIPKNHPLAF